MEGRTDERRLADRAAELHATLPVVELHGDVPQDTWLRRRAGEAAPLADDWVGRWRTAGVDVEALTVGGDMPVSTDGEARPDLRCCEMVLDAVEEAEASDSLVVVRNVADLDAALASGRIGLLLHLEGCRPLLGSLEALEELFELGVRSAQLTWNRANELGDGVGVATPGGLTALGRDAVRELQRLGMLVDVSHLAPRGVEEVLELAERPIVASHANAAALEPHPRNLTDEQIRRIAATGGVIGLCFFPAFIGSPATVDRLIDHAEHIAGLVGVDHLALGPDYVEMALATMLADMSGDPTYGDTQDGLPAWAVFPEGLRRVETLPTLTAALLGRGWSDDDVARLLGGNALRVLRDVLPENR
ncbi:MAG TPA: membrane dipeptidase [Gaiellaceae bacterium]